MSEVRNTKLFSPAANKPRKRDLSVPVVDNINSNTAQQTTGSNNDGLQKPHAESDTSSQRSSLGDVSTTSRDTLSPPDIISRTPTSESRLPKTLDTMVPAGFVGNQQQLTRGPSKSSSSTSLNSDILELQYANQEEILHLTREVRKFQEALGAMRVTFSKDEEILEPIQSRIQEQLKELLFILRSTLNRYPSLSTQDIHSSSLHLIKQVEGLCNQNDSDKSKYFNAVDELAYSFSSSVSEYLMGDIESQAYSTSPIPIPKSYDNLSGLNNNTEHSPSSHSHLDVTEGRAYAVSAVSKEEVENILFELDHGVEIALERAKLWSKYAKDVISFVEKRMHYQMEFAKNLSKLAIATRPILNQGRFLPFQSTLLDSLKYDVENESNCEVTYNQILGHKFVEQLEQRKIDHDKRRKEVRIRWQKMKKEMNDCRSNVEKSKNVYHSRHSEYEKARESAQRIEAETLNSSWGTTSSKVEKRKKTEEDAQLKMKEAETTHKGCIGDANRKQQEMSNLKKVLIIELRESLDHCDQTMKAVTANYFQLQHMLSAPSPLQFQSLCESTKIYEPGFQLSEFVWHHKRSSSVNTPIDSRDPFVFEPYAKSYVSKHRKFSNQSNEGDRNLLSQNNSKGNKQTRGNLLNEAWSPAVVVEDRNSTSGSSNHEGSPAASPRNSHQSSKMSHDVLSSEEEDNDLDDHPVPRITNMLPSTFKNVNLSKAASTHNIRKLIGPSKCRECDGYLYFNGAECTDCGLACHRKCLEVLAINCGKKRIPGRMDIFGVPLQEHLKSTNRDVPFIIAKCISVMEEKYMDVKGIYRCPGLKINVEKLSQTFENGGDLVDLSEKSPHLITNVLKLYIRQLPEPLLTSKFYPQFIMIARESRESKLPLDDPKTVDKLKDIVHQLPLPNFLSVRMLFTHLKRVTLHEKRNGMTASNLGIVFGPNLLKDSVNDSLSALVNMPDNNRAVELLIHNAQIFGNIDTPVEEFGAHPLPPSPRLKSSLNQSANNSTIENSRKKKAKSRPKVGDLFSQESDGDDESGYLESGVWVGESSMNGDDFLTPTPPPRRSHSPKQSARSTSPSVVLRNKGGKSVGQNRLSAPAPMKIVQHQEVERSMSAPIEESSTHTEESLPGMVSLPTSPSESLGLKPSPGSKRREPRFV